MLNNLYENIEKLFWWKAFWELSMDEVAKNLGIKKASLYHYFSSKEDMFLKILEYSFGKYRLFLLDVLTSDKLEQIVSDLITFPYMEKNLFSIVGERWYCCNKQTMDLISERNKEIDEIFSDFWKKYSLSQERLLILRSVVSELG